MKASYLLFSSCWMTLACMEDFLIERLQGPEGAWEEHHVRATEQSALKDCTRGGKPSLKSILHSISTWLHKAEESKHKLFFQQCVGVFLATKDEATYLHLGELGFLVYSDSLYCFIDSAQVIKTSTPSNRQRRNWSDVQWKWRRSWSVWHLPVPTV